MRIDSGRVFKLREHVDRLFQSAEQLSLTIPLSREDLAAAVVATVQANERSNGYIRVVVTRGPGTLGLDPRKCEPAVIIIAEEVVEYPRELYDSGLDVILFETFSFDTTGATLSRASAVRAKATALKAGCLDAIVYGFNGQILGSTDGAIFAVADGLLMAHTKWPVAAEVVIAEATASGVIVVGGLTMEHLAERPSEIFLASTAAGVIGIRSIDGQPVGIGREGPVTRKLRERYREASR
jgi:branched-chain amino acid aminotransferase